MQKVKKIPQRQCVGCREMKDKKSLLRVVKSPEGAVSLDFVGKKPGRGDKRSGKPEKTSEKPGSPAEKAGKAAIRKKSSGGTSAAGPRRLEQSGGRKAAAGGTASGTAVREGGREKPFRKVGSRPSKGNRPKPRGNPNPYAHSRPVKKGKGSFRKKES